MLVVTSFCKSSSHFILSGVDVTGGPATLSPQGHQGFNQDLKKKEDAENKVT